MGFTFDGRRTFRRLPEGSDCAQIVNFQLGQRWLEGKFTVNLAVYDPEDCAARVAPQKAYEYDCSTSRRQRLGLLVRGPLAGLARLPVLGRLFASKDRWWPADDASAVASATDAVLARGLRWLNDNTPARRSTEAGEPGPTPYRPIAPSVLDEQADHSLFCDVFEHVSSQLGEDRWRPDSALALNLPEVPRTIYYAFLLSAEVGGNGFEVYLLDHSATEIIEAHETLKRLDAADLLEMFEAGIPIARGDGAEFTLDERSGWFESFPPSADWPDFPTIDDRAGALASDPFSGLCAAYIRRHRDAL